MIVRIADDEFNRGGNCQQGHHPRGHDLQWAEGQVRESLCDLVWRNPISGGSYFLKENYRVLKGPRVFKERGCSWGTLRIPFGKIGEP